MKKSLCDYRHHPVCRGYKSGTDAYMAIVACFDMLMVRGNPARGRKEGTHLLLFWKKKRNVQGCVSLDSDPMNSIPLRVEELGLGASAGNTWNSQDALGAKLNSGNKKAIWRHYPTRWTSRAKSLRARFWGTTTWGNLTTSRLYQQSSVEFGETYESLKPKTATFYSLVKAPETQKIVCLLWIRELRCTMLSKGNLSSDTMNTLTWSKTHERLTATRCSANKRVSTSFCPWSRSVRNSAITRWNVSDSIDS